MYIRKEAAKSSEIEGTKATIIDVIKKESTLEYKLPQDVDRIIHYIKAMEYGLKRLKKLSLSLGFIREIHKILLEDTVDAPIRKINKIPHISHFRIFFYQVEDLSLIHI